MQGFMGIANDTETAQMALILYSGMQWQVQHSL